MYESKCRVYTSVIYSKHNGDDAPQNLYVLNYNGCFKLKRITMYKE